MNTIPKRLLIAEDDAPIRNLLAYNMRREGFEVVLAVDGNEAVRLADGGLSLALVDLWMPGRDGIEVLRHIRRHFPSVPVVVISAHARENEIRELGAEGAFGFVAKPFRLQELMQVVRAACSVRAAGPAAPAASASAVGARPVDATPALPSAPATP